MASASSAGASSHALAAVHTVQKFVLDQFLPLGTQQAKLPARTCSGFPQAHRRASLGVMLSLLLSFALPGRKLTVLSGGVCLCSSVQPGSHRG